MQITVPVNAAHPSVPALLRRFVSADRYAGVSVLTTYQGPFPA